jgi:uncharacterized protein YxeA
MKKILFSIFCVMMFVFLFSKIFDQLDNGRYQSIVINDHGYVLDTRTGNYNRIYF